MPVSQAFQVSVELKILSSKLFCVHVWVPNLIFKQ